MKTQIIYSKKKVGRVINDTMSATDVRKEKISFSTKAFTPSPKFDLPDFNSDLK